ncbi:WD repeat-containing protein 43 [Hordeum vulgare]|nr:WD repeat-containing protein 43 [Hordeum vulgare]
MNKDWYPSSEEDDTCFEGDDDGNEPMSFVIPSGRRSRTKKRPPKVWYDEDRLHLEQQFQLMLCFRDVYQFREALVNLHVKQLRRPFIGLDGCFIKLTSGAQILAATVRDANNNMYPIAFGVVGVEDTPNWSWFSTQLKYALGGTEEGKFVKYTFMYDRRRVY